MRRKMLAVLLSMAVALSLAGCGKDAKEEKSESPAVTLVYAEVNPLDTISGQTALAFKEKVEEISGGNITIDIQHSGVLGDETTVLESMMKGDSAADLARVSTSMLTSYGAEKTKLLSLPFMFEDREHFWNFASSSLADEFLKEPSDNGYGFRGLFYGEEGFRHFFTSKEVTGIDDFVGMKIRVANDPIMNGIVTGLGATPTVVSFNELYLALQHELVDAAEQPVANYKSNAFMEVAPTLILDGHTLGTTEVVITDAAWDSLTEEQQGWLKEAGKYASSMNHQISEEEENKVLNELKEWGVNVVEVKDIQPWKDACSTLVEQNIKGMEGLYQQIVDME